VEETEEERHLEQKEMAPLPTSMYQAGRHDSLSSLPEGGFVKGLSHSLPMPAAWPFVLL
jgi:hypothetical protein